MNIGKVFLKEWILRTGFLANTNMTKMVMKFPPYVEKNLSGIIKIDKPYEKGLRNHQKLFKLLTDIITQNSMNKSLS